MVKDGLMERFAIDAVYGMHNTPGLPVGQFLTKVGALLAETAEFDVTITGKGGHAATPHQTVDPIAIAAQIVTAAQTITSRTADPLDSVVVSITDLHGGSGTHNVIPSQVTMRGTIRTLRKEDTRSAMKRLRDICEGCAAMHAATAAVDIREGYPLTSNHEAQTDIICRAAERAAGSPQHVSRNASPRMGAEDFSFMLEARPGAMIMIGNGDTAGLHDPLRDRSLAERRADRTAGKVIARSEIRPAAPEGASACFVSD
jgi:hippurate hydrolase